MKKLSILIAVGIVTATLLAACSNISTKDAELKRDETQFSIAVTETQMSKSVVVNIEGIIVEVSKDGNSFLLDTGKWVEVTENTEMGITGPTAAPKSEQYFEETFRVGNSIAGFTENDSTDTVVAYAIYTNWNWEKQLK